MPFWGVRLFCQCGEYLHLQHELKKRFSMKSRFLLPLTCLLWGQCATAHQLPPKQEPSKPQEGVNLLAIPLFREAYQNWREAETVEEQLDPLSVLWGIALQYGRYLDVSQKLAPAIPEPETTKVTYWSVPDIISLLLTANHHQKASLWIEGMVNHDKLLLLPIYPLIAITPEIDSVPLSDADWYNYQTQAFGEKGAENVEKYKDLMNQRHKYTRDQMIVSMFEAGLFR